MAEVQSGFAPVRSLSGLIRSMRPRQWIKNLFVFAALVFSGKALDADALTVSLEAFLAFCGLSASAYLINDIKDREADRAHPKKSLRPIADGTVSPVLAGTTALLLASLSTALSLRIGGLFLLVCISYLVLILAYNWKLKHVVLLDVIALSAGFVLRAVAGAVAIEVVPSVWLLLLTTLVACFFGLTKRRHELLLLGPNAQDHRAIFADYSEGLLDQLISMISSATLVCYALYTFFSGHARSFALLAGTLPIVLYALFRYLFLVYRRDLGGEPEDLLLKDRPLASAGILWVLAVVTILYWPS